MKKIILIFLGAITLSSYAQDFSLSQFYEMPMLRNPALSGIFDGDIRISTAFRNQWSSISVPYQTKLLGVEYKLPINNRSNSYYTLGLQMAVDKAGDLGLSRTNILPVLTYHQSLSDNSDSYLSGSIMFGKSISRFDPANAMLDDQFVNGSYSPSNVSSQFFSNTSKSYTDISAGLVYSSEIGEGSQFYLGASIFHVNKPRLDFFTSESSISKAPKIVFNTGLSSTLNDRMQIQAYVDYYQQSGHKQLYGGLLLLIGITDFVDGKDNMIFTPGISYRLNDAIIPTIRLKAFKMSLGLSYDFTVSQLKTASKSRGGLELTLSFLGFLNNNASSRNKVRCPRFGNSGGIGWFSTR
jgi:type IX secretion system PorP/SprF family membrane protein